jgi:hypothetical protein
VKTQFIITADTDPKTMTVTLTVKQDGEVMFNKQYPTVTDAARYLLDGIAKVMEKRT